MGKHHRIQSKLYVGLVRSVLEYGVAIWGTASKSNFDKVNKMQNQTSSIITGALRSTPILSMETVTDPESLENRRHTTILFKLQNLGGLKQIQCTKDCIHLHNTDLGEPAFR